MLARFALLINSPCQYPLIKSITMSTTCPYPLIKSITMSTTCPCAPNQYLPPDVAEQIFNETLSAMGGYALLQQALGIVPSFLCRGMEGELIMRFNDCEWCNKVKITPEGIDFYAMSFYRFSFAAADRGCQHVETIGDIGREQLQHSFEEFTELSLTPRFERNSDCCCTDVNSEEIN